MCSSGEQILTETELQISHLCSWFENTNGSPYESVSMTSVQAEELTRLLGIPLRRCYVSDRVLNERATALSMSHSEVLASKMPDAGATMAGDFGEVLAYLYHLARQHPRAFFGPKKWRLKQDRTKPAPHSDVVHFLLPSWPEASEDDTLLCTEAKTKSTKGKFKPISKAISDSQKDRTSRLAKTMVWLRERAIGEDLEDVSIEHLNRFIQATDHPTFRKSHYALAVICEDLVEEELQADPPVVPAGNHFVLIVIPKLKEVYTAAFDAAASSVAIADSEAAS